MDIAIVFPGEDAYYLKMGLEIYESYAEAREIIDSISKKTKIDLKGKVIYGHTRLDDYRAFRQVAVLAVSIAFYKVWKSIYHTDVRCFAGDGIGCLTALVCMGALSIGTAVEVLMGRELRPSDIKNTDKDKVLWMNGAWIEEVWRQRKKVAGTLGACLPGHLDAEALERDCCENHIPMILDIGPGNAKAQFTKATETQIIYGYLDEVGDNHHILESFEYRKNFNRVYLLKRMLGMIVSTQNQNDEADTLGYETYVIQPFEQIRLIVQNAEKETKEDGDCRVDDSVIHSCITAVKKVFAYKKTPAEEMQNRFRQLEMETLLEYSWR